ncbi:hypothetical protein SUGI_0556750 [Cryptomeria japonica]|nr:hypothetical protein SUGI_0556750 [Cryptomeria japonica]
MGGYQVRHAQDVGRAVTASILCIERDENVRPTMVQVVHILQRTVDTNTQQFQTSLDTLRDHHTSEEDSDLI